MWGLFPPQMNNCDHNFYLLRNFATILLIINLVEIFNFHPEENIFVKSLNNIEFGKTMEVNYILSLLQLLSLNEFVTCMFNLGM